MRQLDMYMVCQQCGEPHDATLRLIGDTVLCQNCCSPGRHKQGVCALCDRTDVPIERHHVGTRATWPDIVECLCLNCHAQVSERQQQRRHMTGMVATLRRGVTDLIAIARRYHADR